jgi:hypothetical protein
MRSASPADTLRPFLVPALVALLAISSGAGFGVAFGAFEDDMKGGLKASADAVIAERYDNDAAKAKAVVDKSWVYYKRAHLHVGVLGTQALVVTLLLAFMSTVALRLRQAGALLSAVGGLGYGWFWYLAGRAAPALGGTGAAKESLSWLALPSVAAMTLGLAIAIICVVMSLLAKAPAAAPANQTS